MKNLPDKIYVHEISAQELDVKIPFSIEYVRSDAFVKKVINFLNYKLDDVVATRVAGTIIPHHVAKQELIEDFRKYMKGE